jgi:hypothetical protein
MESSSDGGCGEIASDLLVVLVTVAQLIFFVFFYQYIAWYSTGSDGSLIRTSLITDDYFTWLPFPIFASIVVVVASIVMIIFNRAWFRQAAWILFSLLGIAVVVSLLTIFPFDFSRIPNATAANVVPLALTVFLIFMAAFYAISAVVLFLRLRRDKAGSDSE